MSGPYKTFLPVLLLIHLPLAASAGMSPPATSSQSAPYYYGYCGDWSCSVYEDCYSCPDDCGYCYDYCGDGICQSSETCSDCPNDCGSCSEERSVTVVAGGTTKRYWADHAGNAIWRSNPDGSQAELVHSVNEPYGIGFDPATGHLLWTSSADEAVQAAPVDGSGGVFNLQGSFEEHSAIVIKAAPATAAAKAETAASSSTTSVSYSVIGTEVVKLTQDVNTGAEQREVLLTLSSPDEVHGLMLSADGSSLYLGDPVGRMSRKVNISSHAVEWLVFEDYTWPPPMPVNMSPARLKEPAR